MALADNLTHYWKLDEASGNPADSVGSTTLTNSSVTFGTGKINNGAVFSSGTRYLSHASTANLTGDFTISMWVNFSTTSSVSQLYSDWSGSNRNIFIFLNTDGKIYFYRGDGNANQDATEALTAALSASTWYHVVFTQTGTAKKIYVNAGTPTTATATYSGGATSTTSYLGAYQQAGSNYFNGTVDEVGFWTRAITADEVTSLYNGGAGLAYPFPSAFTASPMMHMMAQSGGLM